MKIIGVLTAMSVEYIQIAQLMNESQVEEIFGQHFLKGKIGENRVVLMQCGIGKVNAAMGSTLLIEHFRPDYVISTGVAGGVDECLGIMDVVVSTEQVYHDMWCGPGNAWGQVQGLPERLASDRKLVDIALSLPAKTKIWEGLICTGDFFVSKHEEQQRIKNVFPDALAVDMESCAIAQVCYRNHVPFISFRIISDTPGPKNNISQYEDFWKSIADNSFAVTELFLNNL